MIKMLHIFVEASRKIVTALCTTHHTSTVLQCFRQREGPNTCRLDTAQKTFTLGLSRGCSIAACGLSLSHI